MEWLVLMKILDTAKTNDVIFEEPPTRQTSVAQGLFRLVQVQGRGPDTPGNSQNASGPVVIPLKKGTSDGWWKA